MVRSQSTIYTSDWHTKIMENTNSPWDEPPLPRRHWFAWVHHKPYQVVIAIIVFFTAFILLSKMYSINHRLPLVYAVEPAGSLAKQSALFLSGPMAQSNSQDIEKTVQTIAQSEQVLNVTVYGLDGRKLASSNATWASVSYLKEHAKPAQTLMVPINSVSDKPLGMLQLNIDTSARLEQLQPLLTMQNMLTILLILVSFISGGLGLLAFIRYRLSWPHVKKALRDNIHARH